MAKHEDPIPEEEFLEVDDEDLRSGMGSQGSAGTQDDAVLVTREGLKKLQEELDSLKNVKRKELSARLKEAISYGDLSENSEYEEAKNEQAFIEGRILELETKIKNAKVIKGHHTETLQIGSTVTLRIVGSREKPEDYTIVGTTEADPFSNKISNESPVGKAIMDKLTGERVKVDSPSGQLTVEIVSMK